MQAAQSEKVAQPGKSRRDIAKPVDFTSDFYLSGVCEDGLQEMPFKKFQSYDFVYDSGLPVRVSGSYAEVRRQGAGSADTIYEEVEATIFRDVEIEVEAKEVAPHFSFHKWDMPFAVSDHPFSAHRQLKHQRAMGAIFPFLDLANIPFRDVDEGEQLSPDGRPFSRNFISVLNFLATRGENIWGRGHGFDERQKARILRLGTTGSEYERAQAISKRSLDILRNIPATEKISIDSRGGYVFVYLGKPVKIAAAISEERDAVGFLGCARGD